jgi:EAL domain-containing protein (putative c-di-GMP-specific phosphodiesterase class I)
MGAYVLRTACKQLADWRARGFELSMAVNLSVREVQAPGFLQALTSALAESKLEPHRLEVELTESDAAREPERLAAVLAELAGLGVRIAIDDFGSGYSSLMRLRQMPISVLKVDRFLVKDIVSNPLDAAIVAAVVAMGHSLGLTVVAEGVETKEQLEVLTTLRWSENMATPCDRIQGYLVSKPMPAAQATEWLQCTPSRAALRRTGT